jgi:hypothetical protein
MATFSQVGFCVTRLRTGPHVCAAADEVAAPLKLTRQGRIDAAKAPVGGAGKKVKKGGLLDLMVDPVDICALLPKDWVRSMDETDKDKALKWKERVERVDDLLKHANANPKHIVTPLTADVCKSLRKSLTDSNAAVVAKCVEVCICARSARLVADMSMCANRDRTH